MYSENGFDSPASVFSQLISNTAINNNSKKMLQKVSKDKKAIRSLLLQAVGQSNRRKPSPLRKFEADYGQILFGENGLLTKMIPELRKFYLKKRRKSVIQADKIDTGDLTYLYAPISPNATRNKDMSSKESRLRRSAFFSVDTSNAVDVYNSHTPMINTAYKSPLKTERKKTQYKSLLLPLFQTASLCKSPHAPSQVSERASTKPFRPSMACSTIEHCKKKRCNSMATKDLIKQLGDLQSKRNTSERKLYKIIGRAQTSYSLTNKDKMKQEIKDIEAVYDIQHSDTDDSAERPKTKALMTEVKKRQKEITTTQTTMMKLSKIIGNVNVNTVVSFGDMISSQYEKQKNKSSNRGPSFKSFPNLLFHLKNKEDKRKELIVNSKKMKKMRYNLLRSQRKALNMLDEYNNANKV